MITEDMPARARAEAERQARTYADTREVVLDLSDMRSLALGEVLELAELSGLELADLQARLRTGRPEDVIGFVLALAVVLERRTDPTLTLADARRWSITAVADDAADPTHPGEGPGAGSSR